MEEEPSDLLFLKICQFGIPEDISITPSPYIIKKGTLLSIQSQNLNMFTYLFKKYSENFNVDDVILLLQGINFNNNEIYLFNINVLTIILENIKFSCNILLQKSATIISRNLFNKLNDMSINYDIVNESNVQDNTTSNIDIQNIYKNIMQSL